VPARHVFACLLQAGTSQGHLYLPLDFASATEHLTHSNYVVYERHKFLPRARRLASQASFLRRISFPQLHCVAFSRRLVISADSVSSGDSVWFLLAIQSVLGDSGGSGDSGGPSVTTISGKISGSDDMTVDWLLSSRLAFSRY
jgi:hypothetical protein